MDNLNNLNNDIMQALAQTYLNMLAESHTHEELKKLSVEKLKELKAEYAKKAGSAEGEEKEKHEKELADIESILASRKDDKEEIQQVDEIFDSPAGQKAARSYILKARADKERVGDETDAVYDEIHAKVEAEASHPDSQMGREAVRANFKFMPGGEKLLKDKERLETKYKSRDTGIKRALSKLKPMEESENKDCGCNQVQEEMGQEARAKDVVGKMEKINKLKANANKMRQVGKKK